MLLALTGGVWDRAFAGQNVWTAIGPDGGYAYELCVDRADPRRAWAVTDAGLFATADGHHWRRLPLDDRVVALAKNDGSVLYAGGDSDFEGYVRRSDDGGETWGPRLAVPLEVDELAVDPRTPDTVYASDGWDAIAVSRDGGTTWRVANVDGYLRETLAVDPHRAGRVYADGVGGVHRSDDFGATWSFSAVNGVYTVAADARQPDVVYAGTDEGSLLRSADAGQTWQIFGAGLPDAAIWALASDAVSGALYAGTRRGLFRSDDGGRSWVATGLDPHAVGNLAVAGAAIYAAIGESGIARSVDGGATFERASAGLGRVGGYVAAGADGALYVGASGVFRSADRGRTWTLSARGLRDSDVTALAPHPTHAATLYAGTRSGVFVSHDAGRSWMPTGLVSGEIPEVVREIRALAIHPTAPDHLWASSWEGLYHSADAGQSWSRITHHYLRDEPVAHIALDPRHAGTLYVAGDGGGRCGLLRSRDGGATWQRLCRRDTNFTALVVDPRHPDALYAGMRSRNWSRFGIYRSTDGGRHWTSLSDQPADALAVDPARPSRLYSTGWRYLFRSDDAGATWDPFTAGLFGANVNGFAFLPGSPGLVVAGTWEGIFAVEPHEPCRGDCRGDGQTSVADLVSAVAIGLGAADQGTCAAADRDASGSVDIAELIAAVAAALTGCTDVAGAAWDAPGLFALDREPQQMFATDVDRDGRVDALLVDAGGLHLWRGDGAGAFAPRARQEIAGHLANAQLSDLDGDGAPDLLAYVLSNDHSTPDAVHVLLNDGAGVFRIAGHYRFEPLHSFSFAAGDVDGDGVTDLVLGGDQAAIAVHRGRGDGSFAPARLLSGGGCVSEYDCPRLSAVADLNGDGAADIVLEWTVLLGAGDGTFAAPVSGGGSGLLVRLDDDPILDQVWYRGADHSFAVGAGAGDGTFAPALYFGAGGDCRALTVGDLNHDGAADVVCGVAPGWDDGTPATADRLTIMRNLGDGSFTAPQRLAVPLQPDAVATADVDGDGRLDLLAAGRCASADASCRAAVLAVWRGARP